MKHPMAVLLVACAFLLGGCGVESLSTAATAAALKQKELEAGKKPMAEAERKIAESMQQVQQGAQKAGEADKQ